MTNLGKLIPAPLTSVALLALWLALARTASAGQLLLGIALALVVPLSTQGLRPTAVRLRRPWVVVRYILTVSLDVLRSNADVAWGVVTWRWRRARSQFVIVPLELRNPVALAALCMVTTVVPGTVWSELALDRSALLLHVWDMGDADTFVARFKARYEKPLREIFE
ncbi:MAG TPA: Na+/H+ antiporter subunit E [Polyangiales bacterium]|nr:Na+/H+ antiporter subunit E [Polyangiales bacterium]